MKSTSPPLSAPAAQCIPFAQATFAQLAQAERSVRDKVGGRFPPGTGANALRTLQPDLWVGPETVSLDAQDLARVAQHLHSQQDAALARAGHRPRKYYFTRRPMNCPEEVLRALAELEANPQAGGPAVYQLVTAAARHHAQVLTFYSAEVLYPREADGTDPAQARAALLARVEALDRARGVPGVA
ncbi:hypothetical protein [Hymenobacter sp. IS2118]|uniref:hypothetical protein n=1 Tax=Hymenobacter sp. IS2118 TaxID=1505605 RepID=UPI00054F9CF1|nr:hypothetical protein [Hymenobacter sp. IS2118]